MSDNLPAVRGEELPVPAVPRRDLDSWTEVLPAVVELARAVCDTDFVPAALRNNVGASAAAMMYGREIGLQPMTALNSVHVIKGKVGLYAEAMRAQIMAAGHEIVFEETNTSRCVVRGRRRGSEHWTTVTYTMEDAKQAGLLSNDNYRKNPRRMLQARGTTELASLVFPDVVRGLGVVEVLEDDDESTTPGPPAPTGSAKVARKGRTVSKADPEPVQAAPVPPAPEPEAPAPPTAAQGAEIPLPPPMGAGPAAAGEAVKDGSVEGVEPSRAPLADSPSPAADPANYPVGTEVAVDPWGEPARTESDACGCNGEPHHLGDLGCRPSEPDQNHPTRLPASRAQITMAQSLFSKLDYTDRAERLAAASQIIGIDVPSFTDLSKADIHRLIDTLSKVKTREGLVALLEAIARGDQGA